MIYYKKSMISKACGKTSLGPF